MAVTLTQAAAKKVQDQLQRRGRGIGLKIGVKTTGCSGLAYVLEYVDNAPDATDQFIFECHGVQIWVDGRSMPYVDGLVMDYQRNGLNEGFSFSNPNERDRCGCGESFRV